MFGWIWGRKSSDQTTPVPESSNKVEASAKRKTPEQNKAPARDASLKEGEHFQGDLRTVHNVESATRPVQFSPRQADPPHVYQPDQYQSPFELFTIALKGQNNGSKTQLAKAQSDGTSCKAPSIESPSLPLSQASQTESTPKSQAAGTSASTDAVVSTVQPDLIPIEPPQAESENGIVETAPPAFKFKSVPETDSDNNDDTSIPLAGLTFIEPSPAKNSENDIVETTPSAGSALDKQRLATFPDDSPLAQPFPHAATAVQTNDVESNPEAQPPVIEPSPPGAAAVQNNDVNSSPTQDRGPAAAPYSKINSVSSTILADSVAANPTPDQFYDVAIAHQTASSTTIEAAQPSKNNDVKRSTLEASTEQVQLPKNNDLETNPETAISTAPSTVNPIIPGDSRNGGGGTEVLYDTPIASFTNEPVQPSQNNVVGVSPRLITPSTIEPVQPSQNNVVGVRPHPITPSTIESASPSQYNVVEVSRGPTAPSVAPVANTYMLGSGAASSIQLEPSQISGPQSLLFHNAHPQTPRLQNLPSDSPPDSPRRSPKRRKTSPSLSISLLETSEPQAKRVKLWHTPNNPPPHSPRTLLMTLHLQPNILQNLQAKGPQLPNSGNPGHAIQPLPRKNNVAIVDKDRGSRAPYPSVDGMIMDGLPLRRKKIAQPLVDPNQESQEAERAARGRRGRGGRRRWCH